MRYGWRFDFANAISAVVIWTVGAIYVVLLGLIVVFSIWIYDASKAKAQSHHDQHHTSYQNWVNRAGEGCCNNHDCSALAERDERTSGGVLEVRIEGEWCPVMPKHYLRSGNVPDASTSHVCVWIQSPWQPGGPCKRMLCYQPKPGI